MGPNPVDLAILAVLGVAVVDGLRRGFVPYLTELSALAAGVGLGLWLFRPLGELLHRGLSVGLALAGFTAFLALAALGHAVVATPARRLAAWLQARLQARDWLPVQRLAGALTAAGTAGLGCAVLLSVLWVLPNDFARTPLRHSLLGSAVVARMAALQPPLRQLLVPTNRRPPAVVVREPASNPGADAFYSLSFPADLRLELDPAAEEVMVTKVNQLRAANGLSPLRLDPGLREAAREHSRDMYLRHYFSHQTPDGKTPYDRLREFKVHYFTAGENLAFAPDVDQAWDSLLHSPDHRANILNPDFRCLGVGAYRGLGGYGEMFTQDFADCGS